MWVTGMGIKGKKELSETEGPERHQSADAYGYTVAAIIML